MAGTGNDAGVDDHANNDPADKDRCDPYRRTGRLFVPAGNGISLMSYILEALKKSEKERTLGAVPSLGSDRLPRHGDAQKGWFLGAAMVLVIVAGLFTFRFFSSTTAQQPSLFLDRESGQAPVQLEAETPARTEVPLFQTDQQSPKTTVTQRPVPVGELDLSTQSRLPELSINALSYSVSPSKRFVMINQRIFKEGEDLGNGLKIEEITNSSVVFKFEDMLFSMQP